MTIDSTHFLPSDVELYERNLLESRLEIEKISRFSDGLLGPIGLVLDGVSSATIQRVSDIRYQTSEIG